MPIDRKQLPCWTCTKPQAMDARGWLGAASDVDLEGKLSPSGYPMNCCRVQTVAVLSPAEAAARMNATR